MTNKCLLLSLSVIVFSVVFPLSASAKEVEQINVPEKAGTYSVSERPDLKLRVFVHSPKGVNNPKIKPTPTPPPLPTPVCGLEDPNSETVDTVTPWHLPNIFLYYLNTANVPSSVGSKNLASIVANGFYEWTSAINNKVIIGSAGNTTLTMAKLDGKNIISWGRAPGGTLGITYIWYNSSGEAVEIDTIMNQKYSWSWSNPGTWEGSVCAYPNSYDAQNIMTHELGHWFGVDDDYESSFEDNTMFGYGSMQETKKDTLTNGDITAVRAIYTLN